MIWFPCASTVAATPNIAPGVPASICSALPTNPPGSTGDTSINRLVVAPAVVTPISALPTTRSPFFNKAALSGVLKGAPWAMTLAEVIEGPEKVGTGVGRAALALHWPLTTTPSLGMVDTPVMAITLFELVATTYRVSPAGSYVRPAGPNTAPATPPLQMPVTTSVNDVCASMSKLIRSMVPPALMAPPGAFDT